VSKYELRELGDGRFELCGEVSFHTAQEILRSSEKKFAGLANVDVNLSAVEQTDSSGLALLLEWISRAASAGTEIQFSNIPEKIHAIAVTAEINAVLERSYSSSSSNSSSSK
jgi:phospholipid transport system transporter-binding protein